MMYWFAHACLFERWYLLTGSHHDVLVCSSLYSLFMYVGTPRPTLPKDTRKRATYVVEVATCAQLCGVGRQRQTSVSRTAVWYVQLCGQTSVSAQLCGMYSCVVKRQYPVQLCRQRQTSVSRTTVWRW
jgi:hypothetical protein